MGKEGKIFYLCDGKVPECPKTRCYQHGNECRHTSNIEHAINFEKVSSVAQSYYEGGIPKKHRLKEVKRCKRHYAY